MAFKIKKSNKKNVVIKCLFCSQLLGWARYHNKNVIFLNVFLKKEEIIETKTFEIFCPSCGEGMKIDTGKKTPKTKK